MLWVWVCVKYIVIYSKIQSFVKSVWWKRQETQESAEAIAAATALSLFSSCPAVIANTCNLSIGRRERKMDSYILNRARNF